jgi:hypothetical protein
MHSNSLCRTDPNQNQIRPTTFRADHKSEIKHVDGQTDTETRYPMMYLVILFPTRPLHVAVNRMSSWVQDVSDVKGVLPNSCRRLVQCKCTQTLLKYFVQYVCNECEIMEWWNRCYQTTECSHPNDACDSSGYTLLRAKSKRSDNDGFLNDMNGGGILTGLFFSLSFYFLSLPSCSLLYPASQTMTKGGKKRRGTNITKDRKQICSPIQKGAI